MKKIVIQECQIANMGQREIMSIWLDKGGKIQYKAERGYASFCHQAVAEWKSNGIIGQDGKRYNLKDGKKFLDALKIQYSGMLLKATEE